MFLLEGKDLEIATSELAGFLVDARTKLQRYLNPDGSLKEPFSKGETATEDDHRASMELLLQRHQSDDDTHHQLLVSTAKMVDTTLFRAYMLARPSMAGPLFRLPNFCDAKVVNEKLLETGRYNDLIDFFFGKGLHREALDLLQRFGKRDDKSEVAPQLKGPQRTVGYLQNLPPEMIDLILQYARWPIEVDSELGMEVFLADTENAETLPRATVLDFLESIDTKHAVTYLQHIIDELNDTTPEFHQKLIDIYLKELKTHDSNDDNNKHDLKECLLNFLRSSQHYESWKVLRQLNREGKCKLYYSSLH